MESNSLPGKILCSQKTADHLISLGRQAWLKQQTGLVNAKGKGMMQTYWVNSVKTSVEDWSNSSTSSDEIFFAKENLKDGSIDWMAKVLECALEKVVLNRDTTVQDSYKSFVKSYGMFPNPRDEVTETIILPKPSQKSLKVRDSCTPVSNVVKEQITEYVSCIAELYRNNPFHNFHHASHVVMSTQKLLNRIVRPSESHVSATAYGIATDSLSQFAILFSALIHDVDHPGVSNAQLVKECAPVAIKYNNQSVAEQNSITLAWDLLMEDRFCDFRNQIMPTESEALLFRKLIVNSVMATDLFDSELKKLRETRWSTVFSNDDSQQIGSDKDCNRCATIIIEHIIQASDVCHTMQHWHVYQEWNRRLFDEMYIGYKAGRVEKDPSEGWYNGELWFFDNYIIPLAKKLETCGVFGVSCGELLDYARDNRSEWAAKGHEIVKENLARLECQTSKIEHSWTQTTVQDMNNSDTPISPVFKMQDKTEHNC
jgi:3'5'-cyclic nucleotide phosphodiesterase